LSTREWAEERVAIMCVDGEMTEGLAMTMVRQAWRDGVHRG
jgi:hypothetical protein